MGMKSWSLQVRGVAPMYVPVVQTLVHETGSTVLQPDECMRAAHAAVQLATVTANIERMMKWDTGVQF
jgi:hypothetical protein